jgi:serine/threonine protein kinase
MVNVNTLLMKRDNVPEYRRFGGGGNEIEHSCKNNEITGIQSIKSSDETGDEPNEFVHVIKSVLDNYKKPIIVKIHDSVSYFVDKEITALQKLSEFEHSVKKICDFSCIDDKARWKYMINSPVKFCNHKKDKLHFIVLEYIENGDIDLFFSKNPSKEMICSLFLQLELAIMTLALDYQLSHGDLHSGNILISSTEKSRIHYRVLGKEYRITSYGILPKLIDYGRSTNYMGKIHPSYILDDIYICLSILVNYIRDEELKTKFQQFILDESYTNTSDLHRILVQTKKILLS